MKNIFLNKKVQKVIEIVFSLFGVYILYQILRIMFGGSWWIEEVILGLVMLIGGFVFSLAMSLSEVKTDLRHLRGQFNSLATDFKEHRTEFIDFKIEFRDLRNEFMKLGHKVDLSLKKRK